MYFCHERIKIIDRRTRDFTRTGLPETFKYKGDAESSAAELTRVLGVHLEIMTLAAFDRAHDGEQSHAEYMRENTCALDAD